MVVNLRQNYQVAGERAMLFCDAFLRRALRRSSPLRRHQREKRSSRLLSDLSIGTNVNGATIRQTDKPTN